MIFKLISIVLSPFLVLQGLYTRQVTPQLPEADGNKCGKHGKGEELKLWIIGDSAAAGVGVETQEQALSGRLVSYLAPHFSTNWQLDAKTGVNSEDLLSELANREQQQFDVVVLSIGVNDVTGLTNTNQWSANLTSIIELLTNKFDVKHILFSSIPPMGKFPALPQPLRWWLGIWALKLDRSLQDVTSPISNCSYVPVTIPLVPECIAKDGFHPAATAYDIWAQTLAQEIRNKLTTSEFH